MPDAKTDGNGAHEPSLRRWALHISGQNHLLSLLSSEDRTRLSAVMKRVTAQQGEFVYERHKPIEHVDFPLEGVISIVVRTEEGGAAEVGTVGNEGVAGLPLLLGSVSSPNDAFYQIGGEAIRMPAEAFTKELQEGGPFDNIMRRHAQGFVNQISQSAACNCMHAVEQRLSRWILMCHDRVADDTLRLTQDFLAQMLGVRRTSIGLVAGALQKAGFIRYGRGVIKVLDRAGLQQTCCECYLAVRAEYERLLCER